MSYFNLIKHSLSIITVFKLTVFIRSIVFLVVYILFIYGKISVITLLPVMLIILMIYLIIILSKRENIVELNNSLENIDKIENLK